MPVTRHAQIRLRLVAGEALDRAQPRAVSAHQRRGGDRRLAPRRRLQLLLEREEVVLLHALMKLGAVALPLSPQLTDAERADGSRVVLEATHWTAYVPYAARWPVEVAGVVKGAT